ncbi:MAG: metallophosphoesterase family protein [Candidatus Babeliales bacterium]
MNKVLQKPIFLGFLCISYFFSYANDPVHFDITLSKLHEQALAYPEHTQTPPKSFLSRDALIKTTAQCTTVNTLHLRTPSLWSTGSSPFLTAGAPGFTPFVQRVIIPQESNVYFFGDLHGNFHSLLRTLDYLKKQNVLDDNFYIQNPHAYLIFLGDYVDRGEYGIEVIYTLMRLRMANPRNVFLIRGNHEDMRLNEQYGFADELFDRANYKDADFSTIVQWYDSMPMALFLGVKTNGHIDYIQCCHGGPELGFNASALMASSDAVQYNAITSLNRADHVRQLPIALKNEVLRYIPEHEIDNFVPRAPTSPKTIGLMWADLIEDIANYASPIVAYNKGRGWVHGKELTHYWFKAQSGAYHTLHAIIRGHQHYGHMLQQLVINKGLVRLWDNTAYTVLSAPVAGKQFPYDAYTHLKTAPRFKDWEITPVVVST